MESLYILVPIALVVVVIAVRALFWAINSGQYDDLDTEGSRILFDDEPVPQSQRKPKPKTSESADSSTSETPSKTSKD